MQRLIPIVYWSQAIIYTLICKKIVIKEPLVIPWVHPTLPMPPLLLPINQACHGDNAAYGVVPELSFEAMH